MAWANSKIFVALPEDSFEDTAAFNVDADVLKAALYNNTPVPDQTVSSALSAYAAATSQWVTANEVIDATGWPAGGRQLLSVTSTRASNVYTLDAADTVSANGTTTLTNAFGCLVYNDTLTTPVADQGLCYNYFGGANSVTSGTFTIVWNASGVLFLTL